MKLRAIFCLLVSVICAETEITYEFSGGRFGDNLLAYLHAKWISYKYDVPLLYRPFDYSEELVLHEKEVMLNEETMGKRKQIRLSSICPEPFKTKNCLFICPYFSEINWEFSVNNWFSFKADWKDKEFRKIARELIAPKEPRELTFPPEGVVSVALHIRDGGNHDDYELRFKHPLKVPPLSFYIDSLKQILKICNGQPVYCYCFTDALNPSKLISEIRKSLPKKAPIIFDYRRADNHDKINVIEDFFSLFNFDILIRAASNYSIVPALIHDYALVFYPEKFFINGTDVKITEIIIDRNEELLQACLAR